MARGWESKAVESQIESAAAYERQRKVNEITAAAASRLRERESLELSRTRVLQDLAKAENPKYRELLARSLGFLDEKLAEFETKEPKAMSQRA